MYILLQFYLNFLVEIMIKSFFELCRLLSRKRYIIRHSSLGGLGRLFSAESNDMRHEGVRSE